MEINGKNDLPAFLISKALNRSPDSDLLQKTPSRKPPNRRARNPSSSGGGVRLKREGVPSWKRSSPGTRWKFDDDREKDASVKKEKRPPEFGQNSGRKVRGGGKDVMALARKLTAGLWRLQLPEAPTNCGGRCSVPKNDGFGFQSAVSHSGIYSPAHHNRKSCDSPSKDLGQSPHSVSGPRNGFLNKLEPSFHFSNSAMEGATKSDPDCWKTLDEVKQIYGHSKHLEQQVDVVSMMSALKVELEHARSRVHELETERRSSKKKLEHFLKKLSEERATWRSREHKKIHAIIDDIKGDLNRERKNRQRMEIVNSKLVNELADVKLSAKRFMQDYEKEQKTRELIEEVCDELAKEIGEDKAEVEALKREYSKMREEVDDERKMLQIAEVWREERVQMKLVDAKVTLEEKYSHMNKLVAYLETFLSSKGAIINKEEMRGTEILRHHAASVNIQDIRDFKYECPNPDDIFCVFEDVNLRETNAREVEPSAVYSPDSHATKIRTVSPEIHMFKNDGVQRHSIVYFDQNGDIDEEDDESGWKTVSHPEDQGSSYSPNGSDSSVNNIHLYSNTSGRITEWEEENAYDDETPISEISEVCSLPPKQIKRVSSVYRLWRSCPSNGENYKILSVEGMNGQLSNGAVIS